MQKYVGSFIWWPEKYFGPEVNFKENKKWGKLAYQHVIIFFILTHWLENRFKENEDLSCNIILK